MIVYVVVITIIYILLVFALNLFWYCKCKTLDNKWREICLRLLNHTIYEDMNEENEVSE